LDVPKWKITKKNFTYKFCRMITNTLDMIISTVTNTLDMIISTVTNTLDMIISTAEDTCSSPAIILMYRQNMIMSKFHCFQKMDKSRDHCSSHRPSTWCGVRPKPWQIVPYVSHSIKRAENHQFSSSWVVFCFVLLITMYNCKMKRWWLYSCILFKFFWRKKNAYLLVIEYSHGSVF
jgi:hypothetical protein